MSKKNWFAKVVTDKLDDNVFLASIVVRSASDPGALPISIDSRPSDALALALRADAPVFVAHDVLEHATVDETSQAETVRMLLENLRPEDLGKYEM